MKLNHFNLTVTDVPATRTFLVEHFGLRDGGGNHNMAFVTDDNGMVLTLTSMKVGKETEVKYPASFHIGFIQESEERVNAMKRRGDAASAEHRITDTSGRWVRGKLRSG